MKDDKRLLCFVLKFARRDWGEEFQGWGWCVNTYYTALRILPVTGTCVTKKKYISQHVFDTLQVKTAFKDSGQIK